MKSALKSALLTLTLIVCYQSAYAQTGGGFGIKGGMNYNSNGQYFRDAEAIWGDPMNNLGYHFGLFGKIKAGPLFIRPEVNYTNLISEVNLVSLKTQRIDAPLLVGINVFVPFISVFAGPSFHYYLEDELRNFDFDKFNAGYQFGVGLNLGPVGLDLRYERVLNGQTIDIENVLTGEGDFRFQQVLLGLSFKF